MSKVLFHPIPLFLIFFFFFYLCPFSVFFPPAFPPLLLLLIIFNYSLVPRRLPLSSLDNFVVVVFQRFPNLSHVFSRSKLWGL